MLSHEIISLAAKHILAFLAFEHRRSIICLNCELCKLILLSSYPSAVGGSIVEGDNKMLGVGIRPSTMI